MCVCVFLCCVVLCVGRGLALDSSSNQGVLPNVCGSRSPLRKAKVRKDCRSQLKKKTFCCFSTNVYCCKSNFVIVSIRKLLDTPSYLCILQEFTKSECWESIYYALCSRSWHSSLQSYVLNSQGRVLLEEANSSSASQEIIRLLWNPAFHYRVQNSTLRVPTLSQMHPVHTFPHYFPKIHCTSIYT
jgi:hypothetical protein